MKLVEDNDQHLYKILIYGKSDTGKTALAGSLQQVCPVFFIDAEQGKDTLKDMEKITRKPHWPTMIMSAENMRDVTDDFDKVKEAIRTKGIRAVVIDTITRLQQYTLVDLVDTTDPKGRNARIDRDDTNQKDWGRMLIQIMRLMRQLPMLGVHVIVLAQAEVVEGQDERGNVVVREIRPFFRGQFKDMAGGFFDIVGYLEKFKAPSGHLRRLHFRDHPLAFTRSRYSALPNHLDNPTFAEIVRHLKSGDAAA